jgi:ligand-binding sensor domain-containing protein
MKQFLYFVICILISTQGFSQGQWDIYNTSNSNLPSNYISYAAKDSNSLWLSTGGIYGVYIYDNQVFNHWDSLGIYGSSSIYVDGSNNKWMGVNNMLYKLNDYDSIVQIEIFNDTIGSGVTSISMDSQSNIWLGTASSGIFMYDHNVWTQFDTSNSSIPGNEISNIHCDTSNGVVLIGSVYDGLIKFDGTNWINYNTQNSPIPHNRIVAMKMDRNGKLWLGTLGGLLSFDGTNWQIYTISNSALQDNYVFSLNVENDSILWIGYAGNGISRMTSTTWQHYNTSNSPLPDNQINNIEIESNGRKWFCTGTGGLVSLMDSTLLTDLRLLPTYEDKILFKSLPNPFSTKTLIQFEVDDFSHVEVDIFSSDGRYIKRLMDSNLEKGVYDIPFEVRGQYIGEYYCKLRVDGKERVLKLLVVN